MGEILTERSGSVLRITLNRPAKKNAMTSSMYLNMAEILNGAAKDDDVLVVLWDAPETRSPPATTSKIS